MNTNRHQFRNRRSQTAAAGN